MLGTGMSPVVWERVWAKHKTIVTGWATSNKKFHANWIETTDPEFMFMGGVHVGNSIKELESTLGISINRLNETKKTDRLYYIPLGYEYDNDLISIYHQNGIITKIEVVIINEWPGGFPVPDSEKAGLFVQKKRKEMGIPEPINFHYYD